MTRFSTPTVIACAVFVASIASTAFAGKITGAIPFAGINSIAGTGIPPLDAANNDDVVGASPNTVWVTQKDYVVNAPVDLVFTVEPTGGTTEYQITEGVQNSTGVDWTGYHIELGFGTGGSFVKSAPGDGLDFDAPDYNSPIEFNPGPGFSTVNVYEDDIIASDGLVENFWFIGYLVFNIDVPDGITEFTLRQSPVPVPEPTSLALLGAGLLLAVRRR